MSCGMYSAHLCMCEHVGVGWGGVRKYVRTCVWVCVSVFGDRGGGVSICVWRVSCLLSSTKDASPNLHRVLLLTKE